MAWRRALQFLSNSLSFVKSIRPNHPEFLGKTPWDWLVSVGLPIAAVLIVLVEIDSNRKATLLEIEANREALQESFDAQRQFNQQQTLQNYLSQMVVLMSEQELINQPSDSQAAQAATSLTISVLNLISPQEKRALFDFLYQSGLIDSQSPTISFNGSDLSKIDLSSSALKIKPALSIDREIELSQGVSLAGADLQNATLAALDFSKTDLQNADLTAADMRESKLSENSLYGITLNRTNLHKADLQALDFSKAANISKVDFTEANLSNSVFSSTSLSEVNFTNANLQLAQMIDLDLSSSIFRYADLSGADLSEAIFRDSRNICAPTLDSGVRDPAQCSYDPREATTFYRATLVATELSGLDLSGIDFTLANLARANLVNTNFFAANLQKSNLSYANLRGVDFSSAKLYGATFYRSNLKDTKFHRADLWRADLSNAKDLSVDSLEGAVLCHTKLPSNFKINSYTGCMELFMRRNFWWIYLVTMLYGIKTLRDKN
ncbi:MAG: pentapeptide repeat-containing protein [Phormidesmis sp.]